MASNAAEGWVPQDPKVISYGEYKLRDAEIIYLGQPVTDDGRDTGDGNKVWLKAYDDASGIAMCPGVAISQKLNKGHPDADRLGLGDLRRDLRLMQWGIVPMVHITDTGALNFKTKLAPAVGGFQEWTTGMDGLGYLWQYQSSVGWMSLVFIMPC